MSALQANLAVAAAILLAGISLLMMVIGLVSYQRLRHGRLLWVSVAFAGFFGLGLYYTMTAYAKRADIANGQESLPALILVNLGIVAALYLAVLKR